MEGFAWAEWIGLVRQGYAEMAKTTPQPSLFIAPELPRMLEEAGFTNVTVQIFKIPMNTWARNRRLKMAGAFLREISLDINAPLSRMTLIPGLGWSPEQVDAYLVNVRKSLRNPDYHVYIDFHVVYGQKPFNSVVT